MPETILGRALSPEESALVAARPLESLPLNRLTLKSLAEKGLKTVGGLADAPLDLLKFSSRRLRTLRQALLLALAENFSPKDLAGAPLTELPMRLRGLLDHLEGRRRLVIERANGLWDGHMPETTQVANALGIAYVTVRHDIERATADLRSLLKSGSEEFKPALRGLYLDLLKSRQGMAGFHEWEDSSSALYFGQHEACLAFAFLCRITETKPELLVTVGLDHICFDSVSTKYRHDQVVDVVKALLLNLGRPISLDEIVHRLKKEARIETTPQFVRRCLELSRELGVEKSGFAGLRSWPYFNADSVHSMAHAALVALGEPAHWDEIADMVDRLYPHRAPVNRETLHHMLCIHKEEFVIARHGGVFGLPEWNLETPCNLKDFLTVFIREKGGRAKRQEMLAAAAEKGYKAASVSSILHMNKDIFKRASWGQWELAFTASPAMPRAVG